MSDSLPLVMAITGASGAPYAIRLLEVLASTGREIHLVASKSATQVFQAEASRILHADRPSAEDLLGRPANNVVPWDYRNVGATIASGSFRTAGMVICPCSMSTLASIAHGQNSNLIHRAAEVHLKERRRLILVPRETPLSLVALDNMASVTRAGGVVLPAMPGFYHAPKTIEDLIDFIVGRICDQLGIEHQIGKRWSSNT